MAMEKIETKKEAKKINRVKYDLVSPLNPTMRIASPIYFTLFTDTNFLCFFQI